MARFTSNQLHIMATRRGIEPGFTPTPDRKPRDNEESRNQRGLIRWWQLACRGFGVPEILLFSIPNGGGRSGPIVGAILKAEGLRTGAPDLLLAVPRYERESDGAVLRSGLFIEMKTEAGRVRREQEVFMQRLREQGYRVEVCRSARAATDVITDYLRQ